MHSVNIGYIGNCGEEFSGILYDFHNDSGTKINCVCDNDIKRGLYCVEKYFCRFNEDYQTILKDSEINLVIVESCGTLRKNVILDAVNAGKAIYVILDEKTLMEIDSISAVLQEAQNTHGRPAVFVTIDELDNELFANLPITQKDLGKILNVSIGLPGGDRDDVKFQRLAYDAVRRIYGLLGKPESMISLSNRNEAVGVDGSRQFSAGAVFQFADSAIAHVMIGGPGREEEIDIYGTQGAAFIQGDEIIYNLGGDGWRLNELSVQKRRTIRWMPFVVDAIRNGMDISQHTLQEADCMAKMLRCILNL